MALSTIILLVSLVAAIMLAIYEKQEHHDGMMSDTGRRIISSRIRSIMKMEQRYMETDKYSTSTPS